LIYFSALSSNGDRNIQMDTYTVKIVQFEGPFDLLLYFIQRDELDIYDIPIAKITDDFLGYIHSLESLNLDVASEFILVAATLMRIKAKMLIPRKELDEEGNEIDPREELVNRLIEYKKYKDVLPLFEKLEQDRSLKHQRGNTSNEIKKISSIALIDAELEDLSSYKLFRAFQRVLERYKNVQDKYVHQIVQFPYTVKEQQEFIINELSEKEKLSFDELFAELENRMHAIVSFLALLELINAQLVEMLDGEGINSFWISNKKIAAIEEE